jgi:hypothetical protein
VCVIALCARTQALDETGDKTLLAVVAPRVGDAGKAVVSFEPLFQVRMRRIVTCAVMCGDSESTLFRATTLSTSLRRRSLPSTNLCHKPKHLIYAPYALLIATLQI